MGTNLKTGFLGSRPISRVKVIKTITNILSMTRTTIPNLTLFSGIKIILKSSFYIKTLDRFQDNVRFSVFEHILNLNHCRVFETNPTFPSIIKTSLNLKTINLQNWPISYTQR